jgi:CheY-specific phosphatase CheX
MKAEYVNPFIEGIYSSFATALHCPVERGSVHWSEQSAVGGDIIAVIDLSGPARGHVALTFPLTTAQRIVTRLADRKGSVIEEAVGTGMAELVNLFANRARDGFREEGPEPLTLHVRPVLESTPGSSVTLPAGAWLDIPFLSELGAFELRISLTAEKG